MLLDEEVLYLHNGLNHLKPRDLKDSVMVILNSAGGVFNDLFIDDVNEKSIYLLNNDGRIHYKYGTFRGGPITDAVLRRFPLTPEGEAFVKRFL